MRPIQIHQKLKPYSTEPATQIPLVQAGLILKFFPTYFEVLKEGQVLCRVTLELNEAPSSFVASLNLHKGWIEMQLGLKKGSLHYCLQVNGGNLSLLLKRAPFEVLKGTLQNKSSKKPFKVSKKKEIDLLELSEVICFSNLELLSLGSHKKQNIDQVKARADFKEIMPLLFVLGQYAKEKRTKTTGENFSFIHEARELIEKKKHDKLLSTLKPLLKTGFSNLLVPHVKDPNHWGFEVPALKSSAPSRFTLLSELYWLSRAFFFKRESKTLFFLPHLPHEFHCGRILHLIEERLEIEMEWSKKTLKRMKITAHKAQTFKIAFQKHIQKCRIRVENKPTVFKNRSEFTFEKAKTYIFDRFEK